MPHNPATLADLKFLESLITAMKDAGVSPDKQASLLELFHSRQGSSGAYAPTAKTLSPLELQMHNALIEANRVIRYAETKIRDFGFYQHGIDTARRVCDEVSKLRYP